MDPADADVVLQNQLAPSLRTLQPTALQAIQHQVHHSNTLASQLAPELSSLGSSGRNAFEQRLTNDLHNGAQVPPIHTPHKFDRQNIHNSQANASPHTPQHQQHGGQFNLLSLNESPLSSRHEALARLQQEHDLFSTPDGGEKPSSHIDNMKVIPNPPNLQEWRAKLFNVDDMITLTEDEFRTYFPHVDNVYSHRSTQRYKRKPFVSHYWDCRLKGRPPGTPKSEDPTKKKRKRTARERDLCDVKIKVMEYFPTQSSTRSFRTPSITQPQIGAEDEMDIFAGSQADGSPMQLHGQNSFGLLTSNLGDLPPGHPAMNGQRFFTIQRVNGSGGNGKGENITGPHKHTLADSDKVKKNSVQRFMVKEAKEKKKTQKLYHKKATGLALNTVKKHIKESDLKLFGSCFCPFVQRVWIALEAKGLNYQYIEVDPYKKPESLLEINPRGLVPAMRHGNFSSYESTVLMEYLEDLNISPPLLPINNPQARAHCRLWTDHINRTIVPGFYRCLQAQDQSKQMEYAEELKIEISKLVDVCHHPGPFFLGNTMSFVDIQFAPWILRMSRVLKHYRNWPDPEAGSRWSLWVDAIEENEHVKATTSTDDLYLDSYERYAENRPHTSLLATAVNLGRPLP